jgi:hypothetical protein
MPAIQPALLQNGGAYTLLGGIACCMSHIGVPQEHSKSSSEEQGHFESEEQEPYYNS